MALSLALGCGYKRKTIGHKGNRQGFWVT